MAGQTTAAASGRTPRLLIVAHFTEPFAGMASARPSRLARFLAERGAPPLLVTAAPEFYDGATRPGPSVRDELSTYEVSRTALHRFLARCGPVGRHVLNLRLMSAYGDAITGALAENAKPDFLYFWGGSFLYFPLGRRFLASHAIPYVLDFPDVYYAGGTRYRLGHRRGLRRLADRIVESRSVAEASLIVHTTPAQTALYRERYPALPSYRFATVRRGYDADAARRVVRAERPGDDVFRIGIFGKFAAYGADDARMLAEAVGMFHARTRVLVTQVGDPEPALEEAFRLEGLSDCFHSAGPMEYADGMGLLAAADALVLNAISDVSVPAKTYDYIHLNRPIVGLVEGDSEAGRFLGGFPGALAAHRADAVRDAFERIRTDRVRELEPGLDPSEFSEQAQFQVFLDALREAQAHG